MPPKQNRATAIDNVNKDLVKDRMCSFGDLLEDRQTDRQTVTGMLITILRSSTV